MTETNDQKELSQEELELKLASEMEIIDLPPSKEEVVEQQKVETKTTVNNITWLRKEEDRLRLEIDKLHNQIKKSQEELGNAKIEVLKEVSKKGEVVTKKVAAIEVSSQIKKTQLFTMISTIALLIGFGLVSVVKAVNIITGIPLLIGLGAWGYHFTMNKRLQETLRVKYGI